MSTSPMTSEVAGAKPIPIKKVLVNDPSELPAHYCSTPGGTIFSTTPRGTKIVYEKNFLMNLRNSPLSKTPPNSYIPDTIRKGSNSSTKNGYKSGRSNSKLMNKQNIEHNKYQNDTTDDQFQIEL